MIEELLSELSKEEQMTVHRLCLAAIERRIVSCTKTLSKLSVMPDCLSDGKDKIKEDIVTLKRLKGNYMAKNKLASRYAFCPVERKFKSVMHFAKRSA